MAEKEKDINKGKRIPTLEEYQDMRAAQVRDSAAASILGQRFPSVPRVPSEHPVSKLAAYLGASDETRFNWFGANPDPSTCIWTSTDKFGDRYARVSGNKTFKENPGKYGFVGIPMEESRIGDMIQFNINYGQPNEEPTHAAIYTGNSDEGDILLSYSRGGTGEYTETDAGLMPTMAKNMDIGFVSEQLGTPEAFRYVGTPQKKEEWAREYSKKYNVPYNPFRNFRMPEYSEKTDAINVPVVSSAPKKVERHEPVRAFEDKVAFNKMMEANSVQNTAVPQYKSKSSFYDKGGFLKPRDAWETLTLPEQAAMIGAAVNQGIYNLQEIRQKYNEFAEGGSKKEEEEINTNSYSVGNLVDALYQNNPREEYLGEPSHHYDFTQSEEWANAHGYYPDARGHRDDRVKKPAHPSHPSRGTWDGDRFILTDVGMQNLNYTLFGLNDGGQDPQAVLTYNNSVVLPEVTVTPKGNFFYNPYDNIKLHYAKGGKIHIKPSKRGTFTAVASKHGMGVQQFASRVLAHPENYSPAMRKKANASHWKHGLGGNLFDGEEEGSQKMQRASDYRYVLDDDGEWNRVANDEMGRIFQGLTVTPRKTKQKFVPERIDNSLEAAKARDKFFQYKDEEGHIKGEPGLEIVSPEFEILMGARMAMPTYSQQAIKNYQVGKAMKLQPKNMPKVSKEFRSEEWGNFLNTRNGDNYYRMANIEKETANGYSPKENYFVSHTTPWEEFSGMKGIEDPAMIGKNLPTFHNRLYEFPSKTFGTRKSSSWEGVLGDTNVDVMGKNHLYYGDTSSGVRGPVRVISDTNADYLGISPYKIGITDRPLTINGLYDKTPVYEDIYMGNQTVLNGKELQEAIQNSTYNIFDHTPLFFMGKDATPSGITKIIHINR